MGACRLQNGIFMQARYVRRGTRLLGVVCSIGFAALVPLLLCGAAMAEPGIYEAEQATLLGSNRIIEDPLAWQGKAAGSFSEEGDCVIFQIEVPEDGFYDLAFSGKGIGAEKHNLVYVDDLEIDEIRCPEGVYGTDVLRKTSLSAGRHEVRVQKQWGWFYLDRLTVTQAEPVSDSVYEPVPTLCNRNATEETKALYDFLRESYGHYTLSGQHAPDGINSDEISAIVSITGKHPALINLDMANYTPSRLVFGSYTGDAVEHAIAYHRAGGIVSLSWHWSAPSHSILPNGQGVSEIPWWHGYLEENSSFDLKRVMYGEDPDGLRALDRDIQAIAVQLKRLEAEGVPILWRPLHEASGGWFWWGGDGPEIYKQFWIYLYRELTDVYQCNNLIWVCNCQDPAWYPGDEYVDMIGDDIYALPRQYGPQTSSFVELTEYPGKTKIAALTENGVVPDIELCLQANVHWAWFCTWNEEYVMKDGAYSSEYTEAQMLRKVYDNPAVLTLEDLPELMRNKDAAP